MGKLPENIELAFLVRAKGNPLATGNSEYWHCYAWPVLIDTATTDAECCLGRVRAITPCSECNELEDFQVFSQGNADAEPRYLYAWKAEYKDVHTVRLENADQMLKILRRIDKGLLKINETDGHPKTFGQFVGRIGKLLGVTRMLFPPPNGEPEWANGYQYDVSTLGEGVNRIDRIVWEWEHALEKEECCAG